MTGLTQSGGAHRACIAAISAAISIVALLCLADTPVAAQMLTDSFAGLSTSSNEPIDIESDTLEVRDAEKVAVFRGNVKAVQGGMTLRSHKLHVDYTGDATQAGNAGSEITRILADGKVLIVTDQDQRATSDWADFDVRAQTVTIGGNVVLSQGENVIKGDRLVIDLKTGRSRFENEDATSTRHRVRGLFNPRRPDNGADRDSEAPPPPAADEWAPQG